MKTSKIFVIGLALVGFSGWVQEASAQGYSGGGGGYGNGNNGGTTVMAVPRVAVAPNYYTGGGGVSCVTVRTPMIRRQWIPRQFFMGAGMRLGGVPRNGNYAGRNGGLY